MTLLYGRGYAPPVAQSKTETLTPPKMSCKKTCVCWRSLHMIGGGDAPEPMRS